MMPQLGGWVAVSSAPWKKDKGVLWGYEGTDKNTILGRENNDSHPFLILGYWATSLRQSVPIWYKKV